MVTRAAHLESCPDLNTDTFLNALRRFASRRCQPKHFLSDNGKTFVGANEELKRCVRSLDNQRIASKLFIKNTVWKFNPPYGPQFGGAWEQLIQKAKRIILIILGSKRLTLDVFHTLMVETESMLNSRLLTHVADVPDNEDPSPQIIFWCRDLTIHCHQETFRQPCQHPSIRGRTRSCL